MALGMIYEKQSQIVMEWKKIVVVKLYLSNFKGHKGVFWHSHGFRIQECVTICFLLCFHGLFSCFLCGEIYFRYSLLPLLKFLGLLFYFEGSLSCILGLCH